MIDRIENLLYWIISKIRQKKADDMVQRVAPKGENKCAYCIIQRNNWYKGTSSSRFCIEACNKNDQKYWDLRGEIKHHKGTT